MGTARALWGRVRELPSGRADLLLVAVFLLECNVELTFVDASAAKVAAARALTWRWRVAWLPGGGRRWRRLR